MPVALVFPPKLGAKGVAGTRRICIRRELSFRKSLDTGAEAKKTSVLDIARFRRMSLKLIELRGYQTDCTPGGLDEVASDSSSCRMMSDPIGDRCQRLCFIEVL